MRNKRILWITTTAIFIALLIGVQALSASFGQLVTGSLVNLILIISVMTGGFASGLTVAVLSPVFAKLIGIGPFWTLIPFIMLGNAVLVLIWHALGKRKFTNTHIVRIITLVVAAVGKFLTLYVGIVKLAVPLLLNLPAQGAQKISAMFSTPQLFTALIGGAIAVAILPVIEKVIKKQ